MAKYPVKTALAIAAFLGIAAIPDLLPEFKNYKIVDWASIPGVLEFTPRNPSSEPVVEEQIRMHPEKAETAPQQHRDPTTRPASVFLEQENLKHFYQALYRTELKEPGAVTRIAHYGDSPTTADLITADARSLFQKQFGDAGHGFILVAKPWAWYGHRGVDVSATGWKVDPATQSTAHDGVYGFGGVSFRGSVGARSTMTLRGEGHRELELAFYGDPQGGTVEFLADGTPIGTISTRQDVAGPGYGSLPIPEQTHKLDLRVTSGQVRLFGVQLRKDTDGVIYDSLGLNGAYVSVLARFFNADQWAEQLRHYNPDLVIVNYGTNESMYAAFVDSVYSREMKEVVRRIRAALPQASILVMSPMDRGQRDSTGEIATAPVLPRLVTMQRKVANETGCAFFNTFEAMGGVGTMGRWYRAEPRLVGGDFIHPMPAGAKLVGGLLYRALFEGYNRYKLETMQRKIASRKEAPAGAVRAN